MIKFEDVYKTYPNGTNALNGATFQIDDGEFVFIVGASGAGKSTIIKLLMREESHSNGHIEINGYSLDKIKQGKIPLLRRTMGVVFQDFRLIESKNVYDNVAFAMRVIGSSSKAVRRRVPYTLGLVGLGHKSRNYPNELSGGEQQRVALARALVNNPRILIADEPTGNVDPQMAREIMELLYMVNQTGTTVVVVTHDKGLVDTFRQRVIKLENGRVISDRTGGYTV